MGHAYGTNIQMGFYSSQAFLSMYDDRNFLILCQRVASCLFNHRELVACDGSVFFSFFFFFSGSTKRSLQAGKVFTFWAHPFIYFRDPYR